LKYLWPYRARLALSIVCVIFIATLWAGGIGMLVPASQILITEEGLHGWAYDKVVGDRLDCKVAERLTPPETPPLDGKQIVEVVEIVSSRDKSRAHLAGLRKGDWIVGLYDADPARRVMRGQALVRELVAAADGAAFELNVLSPTVRHARRVKCELHRAELTSRTLGRIVGMIPESTTRYQLFMGVLVLLVVATILRDLLRFVQEYLVETAVNHSIMDIRCEGYATVMHVPAVYFAAQGTTDLMSRFVQDTNELRTGHITLFGKTMAEPAKAIGSLVMAAVISWKLTMLACLAGPPAYWLIRQFGKRMKRAATKMLESFSEMTSVLEETFTGIRVVKAYTMEGQEKKRFFQVNRRLLKQLNKIAKIDAGTAPTVEALGVVSACGAASIAGWWVLSGDMKPGDFIGLMACLAAMFDPLRKLANVATRFQRSEAAATRIFHLNDLPREHVLANAPALVRHDRSIEFRNVNYRYPNAAEDALREVNLRFEARQTVAIVGPNGSGKTTLLSLVPRLLDPTTGQVLIDGHDISQVSMRSLRRQIGLVSQETVLFHATIGENIAYGLRRPHATDVLAASKKAFVDEFVRDLPDGYDTMVGEHGATLSGGQRQRITIARAILRDPAILIFDEAMSQVDADSEQRIHQAMEEFVRGRTTLMIAHRFQTVMAADRIVVMDGGRVVDVGPHAELHKRCGLYRHLYDTQFTASGSA
jgi:ABC-type multidrug transport system fused ATPase/permease subunit